MQMIQTKKKSWKIQWSSYGISLNCSENNIFYCIGCFQKSFIGFHKIVAENCKVFFKGLKTGMYVGIGIFCISSSRHVLMKGMAYAFLVGQKQVSEKFYLHVLRNPSADIWDLPEAP